MEKQAISGGQADGRSGSRRSPDRWLWVGSLVFHLLVFMLLPTFSTEAKQPLQLLIEIVKPELKRLPVKPRGVINPKPAAVKNVEPAKIPQTEPGPSPAPVPTPTAILKPGAQSVEPEALIPDPQPDTIAATATVPIPEMLAVPTHQPVVVPPPNDPVVEAEQPEVAPDPTTQPPAPVETPTPPTPTLPVPASSTGNTTTPPSPAEAESTTPEVAKPAVAQPMDPQPGSGRPTDSAPGKPALGAEESAEPPGPSALELGMLGEYGDGARKKIRMLIRTPELAREQGLKGKCKFEFELRSDGTLVGIKIVESSSHAVLDEECLEATRVAAPFRHFPSGVPVAAWKFQMEIVFPTY